MPLSINPPRTPFVEKDSLVLTKEGYRFLFSLNRNSGDTASGDITTGPGSGLAGGGTVADGLSLSIASNGVSNSMIRQSAATSVIGRAFSPGGNVADISASADNRVLGRFGGTLQFLDFGRVMETAPLTSYTVAGLPSASPAGRMVYATDARNAGEGAGTGTGSLVVSSGTLWRIPGISTAVAA